MTTDTNRTVDGLRKAHTALLGDLQKLEDAARAAESNPQGQLLARLVAARTHITEHFRFEEQNGYMDSVRKREPRLERTIEQLRDEHRELSRSLDAIIEQARTAPDRNEELRGKVHAWVGQVRQHETRENELVQDAYNRDIGAED